MYFFVGYLARNTFVTHFRLFSIKEKYLLTFCRPGNLNFARRKASIT